MKTVVPRGTVGSNPTPSARSFGPADDGVNRLNGQNRKTYRGEMAELAEGARLLSECRVNGSTEGSNPSLSAKIFLLKNFGEISPICFKNWQNYLV